MADDAPAAAEPQTVTKEDTDAAAPSAKRPAEDEVAKDAEAAPDAKRLKTEAAADVGTETVVGAADADAEVAVAGEAADAAAEATAAAQADDGDAKSAADAGEEPSSKPARRTEPVVLAFRSFANGDECFSYFHELLQRLTPDQDLNEYEFNMVMDLLRKGHPHPHDKIGKGVRAIQIKKHQELDSTCYFVLRVDGSVEDFSYRKCITQLFPEHEMTLKGGSKQRHCGGRCGGRGSGRGGGRDSGGRGGRGGRGGHGRVGRGGRGRGRRG